MKELNYGVLGHVIATQKATLCCLEAECGPMPTTISSLLKVAEQDAATSDATVVVFMAKS